MGFFGPSQLGAFKPPNVNNEIGEIERAAREFAKGKEKEFVKEFVKRAKESHLVRLERYMWKEIDNTDSADIDKGDWDSVERLATEKSVSRDWEDLKDKIEKKKGVDAPIILKIDDVLHLVSGNTRLMVSKALGIEPYVAIVDMTDFDSPEDEDE